MRLSILGGSSPFTAGLFSQLRTVADLVWLSEIVLHGRDASALAAGQAFAAGCLPGVRVSAATDIALALEGADIILHQIRYGGLEGRAEDETYCRKLGVPADETLGPGGLRAALRMRRGLEATSGAIAQVAPGAFVINLTNPLSLSTTLMAQAGVGNLVGVCELPQATGALLAAGVGGSLTWDYVGFNHRGFLHNLKMDGEPALARVLDSLPAQGVGGVPRAVIEDLQAVPTKYFRLFLGRSPVSAYGRAQEVTSIRERLLRQMTAAPTQTPAALAERDQPWWSLAVLPLLLAVGGGLSIRQVLNAPDKAGVTREAWFDVDRAGISASPALAPPVMLDPWLKAFEVHEAACLTALAEPTVRNLKRVRQADPLMTLGRRATGSN
jgi:6-phospho-beta-glucosidase